MLPENSQLSCQLLTSVNQAAGLFAHIDQPQPFWRLAFWQALEQQHAIGPAAGWEIAHIMLECDHQPIAFMPLFIKTHHRGEYIFDHAWAQAYQRHGLNYYPRLVSSVPFTPVSGPRVLLAPSHTLAQVWPYLFAALQQVAEGTAASSWHGLFIDKPAVDFFAQAQPGMAIRHHCQFLWENKHYHGFEDFLSQLTAKKRKSIKVERQKIAAQQIACVRLEGAQIQSADIAFFYQCYANTYAVRGQQPYLTVQFFNQLVATMPEQLLLIIARQQQQSIAAALFFKDCHTLYGRYWGSVKAVDCLHFEVCYYQGIEYAITHQLGFFDPGTQGEHKLIRGFAPVYTYSVHWLAHPGMMQAVSKFCAQEQQYVMQYYQAALNSTPFKQNN